MLVMLIMVNALVLAGQTPAPQAAPTQAVAGRVVDAKGSPLTGVAVSLGGQPLKAPQTVKTGADGVYRFDVVPPGAYTLSLRLGGYNPVNDGLVVVADDPVIRSGPAPPRQVTMTPAGEGQAFRFTTKSGTGRATEALVLVRIQTKFGDIDIAVDTKSAPITAANFLKYVDAGLYDGGRSNRATRPENYNTAPPNRPMMELIQGGLSPDKRAQALPPIPLERTSVTGLKHVRGIVSMARGGPDTATSEFFILLDDQPSLDFGGKRFDDNQGAAAFGVVISGLDVVARIQQQPVEAQNLSPPVTIVSIRRIK
jgi:peptidyl-prolyl cis-trans isomerase A (cyclophilin A)